MRECPLVLRRNSFLPQEGMSSYLMPISSLFRIIIICLPFWFPPFLHVLDGKFPRHPLIELGQLLLLIQVPDLFRGQCFLTISEFRILRSHTQELFYLFCSFLCCLDCCIAKFTTQIQPPMSREQKVCLISSLIKSSKKQQNYSVHI